MTPPSGGYFGEVANGKKYTVFVWFSADKMGTFGQELEMDLVAPVKNRLISRAVQPHIK